jgi:uncharacterized membrane protein (UPF0127 family)
MRIALSLAFLLAAGAAGAQLAVVELGLGMHVVRAEVADNPAARVQGLMHRKALERNAGMLFVFDEDAIHCMWMKNTLVPLSVAFLDRSGAIINIADMQPHSERPHCAARPARYALELNRGWFAERGIGPGAKVRGLEKLPPR